MNQVIYVSFLDCQPAPPGRLKLRSEDGSVMVSLACPGPLKPREGLILPFLAATGSTWLLAIESSPVVLVSVDPISPYQQITLAVDGIDYTLRILFTGAPRNVAGKALTSSSILTPDHSPISSYAEAAAFAATPESVSILDKLNALDSNAHALVTFMPLDKTILVLSKLALAETGLGRVKTTCESKDLLYPISPLSAFVRSICRVYLTNEIIALMKPILMELCEEAVSLSTKSLADQTTFASLAVRLSTAAIEIITTKLPMPFAIALEEALRLNMVDVPTGPLLGAVLTANLVSASIAFPYDFQVSLTTESLQLLTRLHTVVVQALITSVDDSSVDDSGDLSTLVRGLGADIRGKSAVLFHGLAARCHVPNQTFPAIERVSDQRILDQAANVLRPFVTVQRSPVVEPVIPAPIVVGGPVATSPFVSLLEYFKARALNRESKPDHPVHSFHQYHLHTFVHGTHFNPHGPTLSKSPPLEKKRIRKPCRV